MQSAKQEDERMTQDQYKCEECDAATAFPMMERLVRLKDQTLGQALGFCRDLQVQNNLYANG